MFRKEIKVIDCTIRDGGLMNKWKFDNKFVSNVYQALIKAGVDYNAYKNWLGMENMIVTGLRYGFSTFNTTLNEYTVNSDPFLLERTVDESVDYDSLNASWAELVLGIKVEVLHNVFLGFSFRGNVLITSNEPENFKNLYVPGFERVYVNDFGFSFNYTVSYLIPFYRK